MSSTLYLSELLLTVKKGQPMVFNAEGINIVFTRKDNQMLLHVPIDDELSVRVILPAVERKDWTSMTNAQTRAARFAYCRRSLELIHNDIAKQLALLTLEETE